MIGPKHGFRRGRGGVVKLTLDPAERHLLGDLLDQLLNLVEPDTGTAAGSDLELDPLAEIVGITADADRPDDPALARLLPDAYDDPAAAAEFRRFTQADLRRQKADNARTVAATLTRPGTLHLTPAEAQAWLRTLTDLRLVLGIRLGITEESSPDQFTQSEPTRSMYLVYDWLTYHQDRLVHALSRL